VISLAKYRSHRGASDRGRPERGAPDRGGPGQSRPEPCGPERRGPKQGGPGHGSGIGPRPAQRVLLARERATESSALPERLRPRAAESLDVPVSGYVVSCCSRRHQSSAASRRLQQQRVDKVPRPRISVAYRQITSAGPPGAAVAATVTVGSSRRAPETNQAAPGLHARCARGTRRSSR
jgi:hypothetical protein